MPSDNKKIDLASRVFITVFFGLFGTTVEVFFTAISTLLMNYTNDQELNLILKGESYVWMFFIYCLIAPLFDSLYKRIRHLLWVIRSFIYGIIILGIEFLTGLLLDLIIGKCPWEYTVGFSILGYIRLDYIFFWMIFGLVIERIYLFLNVHFKTND